MSNAIQISMTGANKLSKQFEKLSDIKKLKSIRKALRKGAKPLLTASRSLAPVGKSKTNSQSEKKKKTLHPGGLKKSIGFKTGKSKNYPTLHFGTNMKRKIDAFYHVFVRGGTVSHIIPKNGKSKMTFNVNGKQITVQKIHHPGIQKNDFIDKAYSSTKSIIQANIITEIDKEILKYEKKV